LDRKVRPDIVFTRVRLVVFVDGCFWHGCPDHQVIPKSNREYWVPKLRRKAHRDREVDEALSLAGWRVMRVWEHENAAVAANRIDSLVSQRVAHNLGRIPAGA
jgi:DNA mismatch endonuclease (patch repair protein)